jgi:hypothetical protein
MQLITVLAVVCVIGSGLWASVPGSEGPPFKSDNDAGARAAFSEAYKVFMSPRCMNCHPAGDFPLQGDDSHTHFYRVRRGEDGNGVYSMKCANCHQAANQPGMHMPPGAPSISKDDITPRWRLPNANTPLIFQGKSQAQLCEQMKDPKRNGGLRQEQLIEHVSSDSLVLWGWNPGEGRTTPPLTHQVFVDKVKEWLEKGGACPQ